MSLPTSGIVVPLVTPLTPAGDIDIASLSSLIRYVFDAGVDGVLALGSCGESGALSLRQRVTVAGTAVDAARGQGAVVVGVSGLGTAEAMAEARELSTLNPDGFLVYGPVVFPASREEMRRHFRLVAEAASSVPLIAYEIPSRVHASLDPLLLAELAAAGAIAGVKDSGNDLARQRRLVEQTRSLAGFLRCTGAEEAIDGLLLAGFDVAIPGLANIFPPLHVALARAARAKDWATASARQGEIVRLLSLYEAPLPSGSFDAAVLGALKEGLRQRGVIEHNTSSVPFVQPDDQLADYVRQVLSLAKEIMT
jgi:4-hydroxy-tetrahydrodipicolinate synthase